MLRSLLAGDRNPCQIGLSFLKIKLEGRSWLACEVGKDSKDMSVRCSVLLLGNQSLHLLWLSVLCRDKEFRSLHMSLELVS